MNTRKSIAPEDHRASFQLIHGGLPPEREWTAADIRRLTEPTIKQLACVKLKKDAEPMWIPKSYWCVPAPPKRRWDLAHERGKELAVEAVAAMHADGRNAIANILQDMVRATIERELAKPRSKRAKKSDARLDACQIGFLNALGNMLLPITSYRAGE